MLLAFLSDAPWNEIRALQRPLPDGSLTVVTRGVKEDEAIGLRCRARECASRHWRCSYFLRDWSIYHLDIVRSVSQLATKLPTRTNVLAEKKGEATAVALERV